ncbi:GlsB/YeaQ/YmgE family stress response membrane protein [Streptomyces viridosporus]|uniref:GlsB/YeaQ/YmgE family stress response membrane protein n=1 Tax=Streptomyces viridosporus TaxID=67581 RepID=UPI0009BD35CC|nr:GlsB/YeaQ/YmgE family stress response membrane protein [Streptomyces viridosporus]
MSFLWAIIAGLIIGLLAKLVLPGRQPIPLWMTVLLGILGAVAGNALASAFGVRDTGGVDWIRHIFQIGIAAALIAFVTPLWTRRRHHA